MLDAAFIRDNAEQVKENCRNRGVSDVPVDRVVTFEAKRRELVQKRSETAAKKNAISSQFAKATPEQRQALKEQSTALDKEIGVLDDELKLVEDDLLANLILIPNMTHPDAPVGSDAAANRVVAAIRREAEVRLQGQGPRRALRVARSRRLRGRHSRGRPEVLLPEERGRAARNGPRPLRDAKGGGARLRAPDYARPGPQGFLLKGDRSSDA